MWRLSLSGYTNYNFTYRSTLILEHSQISNMQIQWTLEPVEPPMLGLHRPPFTASPQKEGVLLTSPKYFKSRVQNQKWQDGNMIVLWSSCRHRFRCLQLESVILNVPSVVYNFPILTASLMTSGPYIKLQRLWTAIQRSFMKVIHLGLFNQKYNFDFATNMVVPNSNSSGA